MDGGIETWNSHCKYRKSALYLMALEKPWLYVAFRSQLKKQLIAGKDAHGLSKSFH